MAHASMLLRESQALDTKGADSAWSSVPDRGPLLLSQIGVREQQAHSDANNGAHRGQALCSDFAQAFVLSLMISRAAS